MWDKLAGGWQRSVKVALVVGTLLSLVNQGHLIFGGNLTIETGLRIGLNYLIPFSVATYTRFSVLKEQGVFKTDIRTRD